MSFLILVSLFLLVRTNREAVGSIFSVIERKRRPT